MDVLDMMRRFTGGVESSGKPVDPVKPSIRQALQNRGGVIRKQDGQGAATCNSSLQFGKDSILWSTAPAAPVTRALSLDAQPKFPVTRALSEPVSESMPLSSSVWPSDFKMDHLEAGLEKLSGLITEKGKTSAKGIARLIDAVTSSEQTADKTKGVLTRNIGETLFAGEASENASRGDSAMRSALRNRGGVMRNQDGFEAFYGIENSEDKVDLICAPVNDLIGVRQDSLDTPRDGFEIFYGVHDTPPKTAAVPRLRVLSLDGLMNDIGQEDVTCSADDSDVPNYSLDTFRRVY
jgi:hypothetical protein